ncbi:MAG: hypothetical protein QM486_07585 [Flavobacteriaceae bacterium]
MKYLSILTILILISCAENKILEKTGVIEIKYGSGGGFTGEVKSYTLTADSNLLEMGKELTKIDSKKTLAIFNEAKEIKDYTLDEPENMYSFIEIKTKDKTNRIVWAYGSKKVDKRITKLYKKLMLLK